jgi:7-keto-8-aminopelargonate synthetase-like enzyme
MTRTTLGLALAAILLALPAWAQTRYQTEREAQMQREEQMRRDTQQMQRSTQVPVRANPSITAESLRDSYRISAQQRESRATKLSAADYRELARQRRQLDDAIRRVERGGNVGAGDVDRIIGNDTVY